MPNLSVIDRTSTHELSSNELTHYNYRDRQYRCRDNAFTVQRWKSRKYEDSVCTRMTVYRGALRSRLQFHTTRRPHSALDRGPLDGLYFGSSPRAVSSIAEHHSGARFALQICEANSVETIR